MTDETPARTSPTGPHQLLIDFGPVGLFVVSSNILNRFPETKENSIFIATAIFIVATLIAIAYCRWKTGRIPPALIDWVNYHFPVLYIPTIIFALANTPFILKHNIETAPETTPEAQPGA
ncbi:MAG: septation protein IspZ [Caulobacteraceae bacterium]|nr:septation protein IspZ [Caulobacteraceae bacterium]